MPTNGTYTARIMEHTLKATAKGSEFLAVLMEVEGERLTAQIWLTEKAMGIARAQLKVCGFNVDAESLLVLVENPKHLAGREIPIEIYEEEYQGKFTQRIQIITSTVGKKRVVEIEKALRAVKKADATDARPVEDEEIPF